MRMDLLSAPRTISSSRQSPKMSAERQGVPLVVLQAYYPSVVSRVVSLPFAPILEMVAGESV